MAFPRLQVDDDAERVVQDYGRYQRVQRRLEEVTFQNSAYAVRQFLAWRAATGRPPLEAMEPAELAEFVVHEAGRLARPTMATTVGRLRSFVRFLFATGVTARDLSVSVPPVSNARFDALPKALEAGMVDVLLASCDRGRPVGRRDYAILVLMVRLGLRAVEVSRLGLDDIDWRAGEIEVSGKGRRHDRLPLPAEVGEALVDYLRFGRPPTPARSVFIAAHGPATGMAMSAHSVSLVSQTACRRLGIGPIGGHRLRHTAATTLLRSGATLREVAEVLRQSDAATTAMYARVDSASLALAVSPWPEVRS